MKSKPKSGTYTATPASIHLPVKPIPADFKQSQDRSSPFRIIGIKTVETTINGARKRTQELLRECKRRFKNNDPTGVSALLNEYPTLIDDPWVKETFYKLVRSRRYRRPRGRPAGRFNIHPLVMAGLVEKAIQSGEVSTLEKAFHLLSELEWCPYDTAKKLYYQSKNEKRFKAVFVAETDKTRPASDAEIAGLTNVEVLRPGSTIRRTISAVEKPDNT